jgi:hypothetical protein
MRDFRNVVEFPVEEFRQPIDLGRPEDPIFLSQPTDLG